MMRDAGVAQRPEHRIPDPSVAGSSPVSRAMNTNQVKWAAVVAAVLLVGGVVLGGFALWLGSWSAVALAGLLEGAGIGFAILNLNDKE